MAKHENWNGIGEAVYCVEQSTLLPLLFAAVLLTVLVARVQSFSASETESREEPKYIEQWRPGLERSAAITKVTHEEAPLGSDRHAANVTALKELKRHALGMQAPQCLRALHTAYVITIDAIQTDWQNSTFGSHRAIDDAWIRLDEEVQRTRRPDLVPRTRIGEFVFGGSYR